MKGRTVTLKDKFAYLDFITRSRTVNALIDIRAALELATSDLLGTIFPTKKPVRLLGVSISGLVDAQDESPVQIPLLSPRPSPPGAAVRAQKNDGMRQSPPAEL